MMWIGRSKFILTRIKPWYVSSVLWQKKTSFGLENIEQTLRGGLDGERLTKKNKLWIRKYRANFKGGLDGERKI